MAHNRPWYQREGGKMLVACMDLPDAEHKWAYSAIIDMLNDRDRPIDDDATFICSFTSLSKRKWTQVRAHLIAVGKLVLLADGRLSNPQFERERLARMDARERARDQGRIGGIKSAEARAAQGSLNLENGDNRDEIEGDELNSIDIFEPPPSPLARDIHNGSGKHQSAQKERENMPINAPKTPPKTTRNSQPPLENMGEISSPRGRAGSRERVLEIREDTSDKQTSAKPPTHARTREGPPIREPDCLLDDPDLIRLASACTDAAGITARCRRNPAMWRAARLTVRSWRASGVDITGTAVPAIKRELKRMDEPANSLERFTACVDKAQASKPTRAPPPAKLEFDFPDEPPEMLAFRQQLARAVTPARYASFAAGVVFSIGDREPGDHAVLWISPRSPKSSWLPGRVAEENRVALQALAPQLLGVSHVWDRAKVPP